MYDEDDLLPLSALQHLSFCERQWGLIHLENVWEENPLTVEGHHLHDRPDSGGTEVRGDVRIVRGLKLRSLRLGVSGIADVVEFHRVRPVAGPSGEGSGASASVQLRGVSGRWIPFPVEYKRGRPKWGDWDVVQLCAQAMCLEEMLDIPILAGALFYGKTRRRVAVTFDDMLRERTESLVARLHELDTNRVTPSAKYGAWCERCSLISSCQPKVVGDSARTRRHLTSLFSGANDTGEEDYR